LSVVRPTEHGMQFLYTASSWYRCLNNISL